MDVSDRTTKVCVMSKEGGARRILEETTIPTTGDGLRAYLSGKGADWPVVFETGAHCRWMRREAESLGMRAIVANPSKLRMVTESNTKNDRNLVYLCESYGLHTAAEYWAGVIKMNDHQQERIVSRFFREMFNTLANRKIALFGFAFKDDTGDTRETPAGAVARLLAEEHVRLAVTDPKATARCASPPSSSTRATAWTRPGCARSASRC